MVNPTARLRRELIKGLQMTMTMSVDALDVAEPILSGEEMYRPGLEA